MAGSPVDWAALCHHPQVERLIQLALDEDVGSGDVTTSAVFAAPLPAHGRIITRTETVACGMSLAMALLRRLDPDATCTQAAAEGADLAAGATLVELCADLRALLSAERCLLNFLMRLCGIARNARRAVAALPPGTHARIVDTRKTLPGWRLLDKAAVRTGGADNHRMGLFDAILIKDNHVAAAGSVAEAVRRARERAPALPVEVEIDRLDQLEEAIAAGAQIVLLDNFDDESLRRAVATTRGRVLLEASGGITVARLGSVARTGVDRISLGALTHTVMPADLSLELDS